MRIHGTVTKWNDDRGFGFITPARNDGDVFVHISAFPRDGTRPRLNELISFEIEAGPDGKRRAVRVMRPRPPSSSTSTAARSSRRPGSRALGGGVFTLVVMAALGAYGYSAYQRRSAVEALPAADHAAEFAMPAARYSCDGRTMCSQMSSCAEATYFVRNCPNTQMDGDNDGVPCETQWCD